MARVERRLAPDGERVREGYETTEEVTDKVVSPAPLKDPRKEMQRLSQSQVSRNKSRHSPVGIGLGGSQGLGGRCNTKLRSFSYPGSQQTEQLHE